MADIVAEVVKHILRGSEQLQDNPETGLLDISDNQLGNLPEGEEPGRILEAGDDDLLGVYFPMASPGTVRLFKDRHRSFFWGLIDLLLRRHSPLPLMKADLEPMALLVTKATWHHEFFHFYCDIQRHLFPSSRYDRLKEEALANAYAHMKVVEMRNQWSSKLGRMSGYLYNLLIVERFRYTAPGYRDWPNFADPMDFARGVLEYIDPPNWKFLVSSGVAVDEILMGSLESIHQHRAVEESI